MINRIDFQSVKIAVIKLVKTRKTLTFFMGKLSRLFQEAPYGLPP